jgi:hypothetical protein
MMLSVVELTLTSQSLVGTAFKAIDFVFPHWDCGMDALDGLAQLLLKRGEE